MRRLYLKRFLFWLGAKGNLFGLPVSVWAAGAAAEGMLFHKLERALSLISELSPAQFRLMQKDVRSILVLGSPEFNAAFFPDLRIVEIYVRYAMDRDTTPESLACVLIHEAQHARLFRLGFGYEEPIRVRIERLCYRAQRNFARRLPGGNALVEEADYKLANVSDAVFSAEGFLDRRLNALRQIGTPAWVVTAVQWFALRRLARRRKSREPASGKKSDQG